MAEQPAAQEPTLADEDTVEEAPSASPMDSRLHSHTSVQQEGDFPEEPPLVTFLDLSPEAPAPPEPSEPDKECLLGEEVFMQVASPQKGVLHAARDISDPEALQPLPPLPPMQPPALFVASGQLTSEIVSGDAEVHQHWQQAADWQEPPDWAVEPTTYDLRVTADNQGSYPAPPPPDFSLPHPAPALPDLGGTFASPTPHLPQLPDPIPVTDAFLPPTNSPFPPDSLPPALPALRDGVVLPLSKDCEDSQGTKKYTIRSEPSMAGQDSVVASFETSAAMRVLAAYGGKVVRHPCKLICLYFILMCLLIVVMWREFEIDTDFSSFIRADGDAMRRREAYLLALKEKKGPAGSRRLQEDDGEGEASGGDEPEAFKKEGWWRALRRYDGEAALDDELSDEENNMVEIDAESLEASEDSSVLPMREDGEEGVHQGRRLASMFFVKQELAVIYHSIKGNALGDRVLRDVRDLEMRLRSLDGWKKFCGPTLVSPTAARLCDPGESLASYAWPTQEQSTNEFQVFKLAFDGNGRTLLSQSAMMSYLQTRSAENQDLKRFFPKTFEAPAMIGDATYPPPAAIRTAFTFKIVVGRSGDAMSNVKKRVTVVKEDYADFIKNEVFPVLSFTGSPTQEKFEHTNVYYYGDVLTGHEIATTLQSDAFFALGSICFVLFYLLFHTHSMLLSISCLGIIFASIPVAYVLTPASKTTIASFLSLFLMCGVGSDVIFVFTDFWDQSLKLKRPLATRVAWMIVHAGKSCFATSLTTSVSFFANLASVLQPLREFGLFMGLCVMSAFTLVLLFLPPLLIIVEKQSAPRIIDESILAIDSADADEENNKFVRPTYQTGLAQRPLQGFHPELAGVSNTNMRFGENREARMDSKPDKEGEKPFVRWILLFIVGRVGACPGKILVLTGILVIIFIIGVGGSAEMAQGVPEIFPPGHNQVEVEKWAGKFQAVTIPDDPNVGSQGAACMANATAQTRPEVPCIFYWCEASSTEIVGAEDSTSGFCWRGPATVTSVYGVEPEMAHTYKKLKDPWSVEECQQVEVQSRMAGPKFPQSRDWVRTFTPHAEKIIDGKTFTQSAKKVSRMERLALENWETGEITMSNFWDTDAFAGEPYSFNRSKEGPYRQCEVQTLCFFGAPKCVLDGWRPLGELTLSEAPLAPVRRLHEEDETHHHSASRRQLAFTSLAGQTGRYTGPLIAANKRVDVTILFGLRAAGSTPLVGAPAEQWSFDPNFEADNPWAQRAIYDACLNVPAELKVIGTSCWIADWRTWLGNEGERFPSRKFDTKVVEWFSTSSGVIKAPANLWLVNEKVKATKISFTVNYRLDAGAAKSLEYMKLWTNYMKAFNEEASISANRAWCSASLFVRAEAEVAVISSTVETIIIAAVCGWVGMLVFTKDPWTSALVTSLVLGIISGLAFFMVVIMGWSIGPIEVISLVVFVGYSVTYSLHIAHNYVEVSCSDPECERLEMEFIAKERRRKERYAVSAPTETKTVAGDGEEDRSECGWQTFTLQQSRRARTRMAVLHVGGATMSSAVSTMGSSMFLLLCTMNIFVKLGSVVLAVTFLSIGFALVPLPALLMLVGPSEATACSRYGSCLRSARENLPSSPSASRPTPTFRQDAESQPFFDAQVPAPAPPPPDLF